MLEKNDKNFRFLAESVLLDEFSAKDDLPLNFDDALEKLSSIQAAQPADETDDELFDRKGHPSMETLVAEFERLGAKRDEAKELFQKAQQASMDFNKENPRPFYGYEPSVSAKKSALEGHARELSNDVAFLENDMDVVLRSAINVAYGDNISKLKQFNVSASPEEKIIVSPAVFDATDSDDQLKALSIIVPKLDDLNLEPVDLKKIFG